MVQGNSFDEVAEVFEEHQPVKTTADLVVEATADATDTKQTASQAIQHIVNSSWTGILAALSELLRVSSNPTTTEALLR